MTSSEQDALYSAIWAWRYTALARYGHVFGTGCDTFIDASYRFSMSVAYNYTSRYAPHAYLYRRIGYPNNTFSEVCDGL